MASNDLVHFPNVAKLLDEVVEEYKTQQYASMQDALAQYIRKRKYWPMIQTKKFFGQSNMVLLHNTYKRDDVEHFKDLYEEIRSVVLDFDAPSGNMVVVSLADKIPERLSVEEYKTLSKEGDTYEECFEGTMVYVYSHNDNWFFSTSTCPNLNSSKYFHPIKTHGEMFDEVLADMFLDVSKDKLRDEFVSQLNKDMSYGFLLLHHDNKHVMDYSDTFGENYKKLYLIFTRDKKKSTPISGPVVSNKLAVKLHYPTSFATKEEALNTLTTSPMYGLIVKTKENQVYKVSTMDVIKEEQENLGNSNPWVNLLSVYMQQNPEFKINDYIEKYLSDKKEQLIQYDKNGNEMVPVYIIHTVIMTLRDILFNAYFATTYYDMNTKTYTINKELDAQYPAMIRFHLSQLRHLQVSRHRNAYINPQTVYHYLCLHQTMKNIRMLIHHVVNTNYGLNFKAAESVRILDTLLRDNTH